MNEFDEGDRSLKVPRITRLRATFAAGVGVLTGPATQREDCDDRCTVAPDLDVQSSRCLTPRHFHHTRIEHPSVRIDDFEQVIAVG